MKNAQAGLKYPRQWNEIPQAGMKNAQAGMKNTLGKGMKYPRQWNEKCPGRNEKYPR